MLQDLEQTIEFQGHQILTQLTSRDRRNWRIDHTLFFLGGDDIPSHPVSTPINGSRLAVLYAGGIGNVDTQGFLNNTQVVFHSHGLLMYPTPRIIADRRTAFSTLIWMYYSGSVDIRATEFHLVDLESPVGQKAAMVVVSLLKVGGAERQTIVSDISLPI